MNDFWIKLFWAVLPSIIVAVILYKFNKDMKKREAVVEERAKLRKKESLLALKMQMANGKLAYAVAMAVKRGKANGEVEEGTEAYEEVKREYYNFINETHVDIVERGRE